MPSRIRRTRAAATVLSVAAGLGIALAVGPPLGLPLGVLTAIGIPVLWTIASIFLGQPARIRASLLAMADPTFTPSADLRPGRLALADARADPDVALATLLADDFRYLDTDSDREMPRKDFVRAHRRTNRMYCSSTVILDEVLLDPADPTSAWIRLTADTRTWLGRRTTSTWWESWTTTAGQQLLRTSRIAGVTDVR